MKWLLKLFICIYAFILPLENMTQFSKTYTSAYILGSVCLTIWLLLILSGRKIIKPTIFIWIVMVFIIWSIMSIQWSIEKELSLSVAGTYISLIVMTYIIIDVCGSINNANMIMKAYIVGCVLSLVMLYINYITGHGYEGRYTGGMQDHNYLALMYAIAIPMAGYVIYTEKNISRIMKIILWVFMILSAIAIMLTGSRAGSYAAIITITLTVYRYVYKEKRKIRNVIIVVMMIVIFGIVFVPRSNIERIGQMNEAETFKRRTEIWEETIKFVVKRDIVKGMGTGTILIITKDIFERKKSAHNAFVSVFVELGMIGLIIIIMMWLFIIWYSYKNIGGERYMLISIVSGLLVASLSLSMDYHKLTWFVYAIVNIYTVKKKYKN